MHCTHSCSFCMQAFILYCSSTELHSYLTKFLIFCWLDVLTFLEQVNIVVGDLVIKGSLLGGTAEVYQPPLIHDGTHGFTVSQHTTSSLHKKVSNAQTPLWLLRAILLYAALSCTACSNYYTLRILKNLYAAPVASNHMYPPCDYSYMHNQMH